MPTVMIIGASRGIGLELARQYAAAGWRIHATIRTPAQPGELGRLAGNIVLHELDVRNASHIDALAKAVESEGIDVFIHNAGVSDRRLSWDEVMQINAEAPIAVTQALLPAVQRGTEKKIVLMTSQLGARYGSSRRLSTYGESKAVLNDTFRELAPAWGQAGLIAIVMHPGWVRTDMGGAAASLSVEESVSGMRQVIDGLKPAHHGRFWTWDGREHAW
ncbi:SDR family oxidoreductase [Candidatus Entotheonella palauensis]|uniref:SDR family oxidoreductase n=1 Tax=Candidatus Entotheonella palauensis TaxID=93172 RepID=UPI000B7D9790|nr:SDR family oxidoreductase [Candidatus Entotheonella palauensis]